MRHDSFHETPGLNYSWTIHFIFRLHLHLKPLSTESQAVESFAASLRLSVRSRVRVLTFAGSDVVEVQLVALLGSLQGALGGEEVAGGVVGLVVGAANLRRKNPGEFSQL